MIERSEAARYAKALFYVSFNDLDVFVEDTARESRKIYVELLNRVLGHKFSVSQIFPIGPKSIVIKRCASDQASRHRPALYIVDGDYDSLLGFVDTGLKRLYQLKRYCIENYLLDADALIDILADETVDFDEEQIRAKLDFDGWMNHAVPILANLVVAFAVSHVRQCGLPSVHIDLEAIRGVMGDHVDEAKVNAMRVAYERAIDGRYGEGVYASNVALILSSGVTQAELVFNHSSGKSLLMPFIFTRVRRRVGIKIDTRKLKVKLARRCDVSDLRDLVGAVI